MNGVLRLLFRFQLQFYNFNSNYYFFYFYLTQITGTIEFPIKQFEKNIYQLS